MLNVYEKEINKTRHNYYNSSGLIPLYLVITYNIYGTDQIYYPNYVAGFGKIRKSSIPSLNINRTIEYYGFDIASQAIFQQKNIELFFSSKGKNWYIFRNKRISKIKKLLSLIFYHLKTKIKVYTDIFIFLI